MKTTVHVWVGSCSRRVFLRLVQMETEPVPAPQPVFSTGPSVQVACQVSAPLNGPASPTRPDEGPPKMTAEQLAAIEDEELLDKMVRGIAG